MNKQFCEKIINSLPYGLLVLDDMLRIVKWNPGCEHLFSKTEEEVLGSDLSDIIPHRELRIQATAVLQNAGTKLVELHLDTENVKILRATITAINATKQTGGSMCLITLEDISEQSRLEGLFVQSEKMAGMGMLASTVAHELGNPLSIMGSTLQYIRDTLFSEGGQEVNPTVQKSSMTETIDILMDSVGQMHEILQVLSGFSGVQPLRFRSTDLRQILSWLLAFIHKEAEAHNIKVYHRFDDDLGNCEVDQREVKQLFLNLLKNAIEAMPDGGELNVNMYMIENKEAVCIDISDVGHGISEEKLHLIFKPFYSTKSEGKGLGLSFCQRVVEKHGGKINVKSEINKGSTFSVIFPVRQREDYG